MLVDQDLTWYNLLTKRELQCILMSNNTPSNEKMVVSACHSPVFLCFPHW